MRVKYWKGRMKNVQVVTISLLFPFVLLAQWWPNVRLTNDPAISRTSYNNARCVASSGSYVHVVWWDWPYGLGIHYNRSTDNGGTWETDTIPTNTVVSGFPSIAVSGGNVHLVWQDERDGNDEIYYNRSFDNGISWETDMRLTNNIAASCYPSIAVCGSNLHVVWYDGRDGNYEIYYKRSTDNGANWSEDIRLTNNSGYSYCPSIAVSGSNVHVIWYDNRDGNYEIYYKRSTDNGANWSEDIRFTVDTAGSWNPSIAVCGLNVHVVWRDDRDGIRGEIYYKNSLDNGISWSLDTRLTNNPTESQYPSMSVSGSNVHLVWCNYYDGNYEIQYKHSFDNGTIWSADTMLTNDTAWAWCPSVAVSGSCVHIVWMDSYNGNNGNEEIYYKRNPTGNYCIEENKSPISAQLFILKIFPNPVKSLTVIRYSLPTEGKISLQLFDISGRLVKALVNQEKNTGNYSLIWNGTDENNRKVGEGVYFCILKTNGKCLKQKILMIK